MKPIEIITVGELTAMAERMPYKVDRKRWAKLTIFEQMGNIGSEVGRAIRAKQQEKTDDCQQAVIRALDLFEVTVTPLIAQRSVRAREVLRAKEQFLASIYGESSPASQADIEQYFLQYAIAARLTV